MKSFVCIIGLILLHIDVCNLMHIDKNKNYPAKLDENENEKEFKSSFYSSFFISKILIQGLNENYEPIYSELLKIDIDSINFFYIFCTQILENTAKLVFYMKSREKLNLLIINLTAIRKDEVLLKKTNKAIAAQMNLIKAEFDSIKSEIRKLNQPNIHPIKQENQNLNNLYIMLMYERIMCIFKIYFICWQSIIGKYGYEYLQINTIFESCFIKHSRTYELIQNNEYNGVLVVEYKNLKQIYNYDVFYLYAYINSSKTDIFLRENITIYILKIFFLNNFDLLTEIKKLFEKNKFIVTEDIKNNDSYGNFTKKIENMNNDIKISDVKDKIPKKIKDLIIDRKINYVSTCSKIEINFLSLYFIANFIGHQNLHDVVSGMFVNNVDKMVEEFRSYWLNEKESKKEIKNDYIDIIYIYTI